MPNERSGRVGDMCTGVTATGTYPTSPGGPCGAGEKTFQACVSGTAGNLSATVIIEVTNDQTNQPWIALGTITLPSTTYTSANADGFASQAIWGYYRANVTAIGGTGAQVRVTCREE